MGRRVERGGWDGVGKAVRSGGTPGDRFGGYAEGGPFTQGWKPTHRCGASVPDGWRVLVARAPHLLDGSRRGACHGPASPWLGTDRGNRGDGGGEMLRGTLFFFFLRLFCLLCSCACIWLAFGGGATGPIRAKAGLVDAHSDCYAALGAAVDAVSTRGRLCRPRVFIRPVRPPCPRHALLPTVLWRACARAWSQPG